MFLFEKEKKVLFRQEESEIESRDKVKSDYCLNKQRKKLMFSVELLVADCIQDMKKQHLIPKKNKEKRI